MTAEKITISFAGRRTHNRDGRVGYGVWAFTPGASSRVQIGHLTNHGTPNHPVWIVRSLEGDVLVSAADGIGRGACTSRADACTVLGWKMNGDRP